ncbi:MAG: methylated-DNA--[protein]-cysteine S-methyltransferase [Peptococcia bacterium]|jgi:O-6-methylguanine DNA methyltransferase
MQECFYVYHTMIGAITIASNGTGITALYFGAKENGGKYCRTELIDCAALQLYEYLAGKRRQFNVPLAPTGTPFQKLIWQALQTIPYGETRSYRQIAEQVGKPGASRAVGMANHHNPVAIIIPCHRVIGSNGALVGYAGGLALKKYLLALENIH